MKTGLVLEGGAMRGIYTAGVLDVFLEHGIRFDGVIGVSAGALHGTSYLSEQCGRSIRYYEKYSRNKHFMSFYSLLTTGDLVGEKFCYHDLPEKLDPFDYTAFEKNPAAFYVVCTNVETGEAEYVRCDELRTRLEWVRASASMPLVSQVVEIDGGKYLDGGVADSIPLRAFEQRGFAKNVVVLTQTAQYLKTTPNMAPFRAKYGRQYPQFLEAVASRAMRYNAEVVDVEQQAARGEIVLIRPSREMQIGRMERDPARLRAMYELGRADAEAKLDAVTAFLSEQTAADK